MLLVVGFLLLVTSVLTEGTSFKLEAAYNDLDLFQDLSLGSPSHDDQPIECARYCIRTPRCTFFSFNEESKSCQLYGDAVYHNVSLAHRQPGERYFGYRTDTCPVENGFSMYQSVNLCVNVSTVMMNYDSAKLWCEQFGARIVVLEDEDKATAVINMLEELGSTDEFTFVGADDRSTEGQFVWTDGSRMVRNWWMSGEPNSVGGNEDCVLVRQGKLYDIPCHQELRFICEIPGARFMKHS